MRVETSVITHMALGSEKTSAWICIIRSPPAAYSMTKQTCSCVWKHANKLTRNGWRTLLTVSKILFSHIKLAKRKEKTAWVAVKIRTGFTWRHRTHNCSSIIKKPHLSTSSRATMSPFFKALMANISPVLLYSANNTWRRKAEQRNTSEETDSSFCSLYLVGQLIWSN